MWIETVLEIIVGALAFCLGAFAMNRALKWLCEKFD